MSKFSLAGYTLRVREGGEQVEELDDFCDEADLIEILYDRLDSLQNDLSHNPEEQKLTRVSTLHRHDRTITGIIETGEYGFESELIDVGRRRLSHRRTTTEAEMLPFYFLIDIPESADEGIMILERFKQFGIRGSLSADFKEHLAGTCPEAKLFVHPLVPENLVKQYLQDGRIIKISFVTFRIPTDITDAYDTRGHTEEGGHMELSVYARRNGELPLKRRIRDVLTGRRQGSGLVELRDFDYHQVKLQVRVGAGTHTIDLSNLHKLRAHYDVTERVRVDATGHPSFDSMDAAAHDLLILMRQALGREHPDV